MATVVVSGMRVSLLVAFPPWACLCAVLREHALQHTQHAQGGVASARLRCRHRLMHLVV